MHNCTNSCIGTVSESLAAILNQDIDISVRLTQVVQALRTVNGVPQTAQTALSGPFVQVCSDTNEDLLEAIFLQRVDIFNRLNTVLSSV